MRTRLYLRTVLVGFSIICGSPFFLRGQGTFQNLGFESATIVSTNIGGQTFAEFDPAFPGWAGYLGSSAMQYTTYNSPTLGSSWISLVDQPGFAISNITVFLQGGFSDFDADVSLVQNGMISVDTMSLRFLARSAQNTFIVSMDGQPLSLNVLQDFGAFREYGADISAFAGRTAELRFTQPHGFTQRGDVFLDNISFSPNPVPEPSTWTLLSLGSALFWCAARRRGK